jgi:EmrB/QacA subfamily drug resistance transporter
MSISTTGVTERRAPALQTTDVSEPTPRRWTSLAFVALAQLMVALDATIVSIALPSAQATLHAADADRQWVITAYTLSFGGLLLLGGRFADFFGRKRTFLVGLVGFALASALGGSAPNFAILVGARALQGAFGALLAPAALSLLAITFTEPKERAKAFAVYGAIAGSGAAAGMLLGGVLTQYLSWRWCLFVNIPIAVIAGIGGWLVLRDSRSVAKPRFDALGVVLATGSLVALVYGCTQAVSESWQSTEVLTLLAASVALLALFVAWEARSASPLLPLHIVLDRNRGGAYLTVALGIAGMFGAFLFLTYYLQVVLRFTPVQAGLAFLPITVASQAGSWVIAARLMPRLPARFLMAPGALVAALGMALLTQLQPDTNYLTLVLPAEILLGLGTSCVMVPAFSIGTLGVDRREAGIAAATVNTFQQIGGSLGVAVLNTIAASATAAYMAVNSNERLRVEAIVHGYSAATEWGVAILIAGAVVAAALINAGKPSQVSTSEESVRRK